MNRFANTQKNEPQAAAGKDRSVVRQAETPGRLIVFVGVDGVGKTTLSRHAAADLSSQGVYALSHRTIATDEPFVEQCMSGVADLLWPKKNTEFDHLLPAQFYIYLKATWYSLFADFVLMPRLRSGHTVLVDGWYYKFISKMILHGFAEDYLETIFSHVLVPDLVVMLDTEISALWDRRSDFRSHELGLHEGYRELGPQSFINYQNSVRNVLRRMAERHEWDVLTLQPGASVHDSSRQVRDYIAAWMEREGWPARGSGQ